MKVKTIRTKDMVIAALLTSLSILIPNVFPTIPLGPFTATFASHLPTIISMFISPVVALATSVGSLFGFVIKCAGSPWVIARAAMHIPFAMLGVYMLKKHCNIYITGLVTMVVHAVLEVVAVLPFLGMMPMTPKTISLFGMEISLGWATVILIGTMLHHIIDFAIALAVIPALKKAGYIEDKGVWFLWD